jgi:hypothetical protein
VTDSAIGLTFNDDVWRARFEKHGWTDFDTLWQVQADTVEPANVRRGGWSSVVRIEGPDGQAFYLKRQENHDFRDWRQGLQRLPTVAREWQAGLEFRGFGVGTAEPICLGVRQGESSLGLLVTAALDDYRSLPEVLQDPTLASVDRRALWKTLAYGIRRIHEHGYRHNCLYGHHVLLRTNAKGDWEFCLIDLEKVTRTRRMLRATIADLSALDRHTDDMSHRDRQWLWDCYFESVALPTRRKVLMTLARRSSFREVDHYIRDCADGRRPPMGDWDS